ncbi:MAG: filamentous hemagglutinin family protein, partial [Verrucomicrobiales bacterium]
NNSQIIQHSGQAIIEWDGFSIGAGERTQFIQPSSSAAVLNRVLNGRSNIDGILEANGNVLLVNPHGIIVGASGSIDAGSFIASTLDISDADFLAGGDLNFNGGSTEAIVNLGTIRAENGDAILIAARVQNAGQLLAPEGLAGIAAGTDVLLQESGDERLFVRAGAGEIQNDPTGNIEGRVAELKAGGNVYGLAIQQHGRVAATGAVNEGGQIFLRANGGKIVNSTPVAGKQITIDGGDLGEVELTETSALQGNQVSVTTNGGKITSLGSITAVSEDAAPGSIEINAGDFGDIELGPLSRTAGELVTVSSLGGDISSAGQLLGTAGVTDGTLTVDAGLGGSVNLTMDSETSAGAVTVRATGGSILSAGHVVGNDGGSVNFEANDGGEIVVPLGGLIEAGSVEMRASGGSIDHAGTVIAESLDGQGGSVNLDVTPGGAITIQPTGIIRGGDIELLANDGGKIDHAGQIIAKNGPGGGSVTLQATGGEVTLLPTGYIEGGTVTMDAGAGGSVEVFGVIDASSEDGVGGTVTVTGDEVAIRAGARIDASGTDGGGAINIGGGFGGNDSNIHNAKNTTIEAGAALRADATVDGPGGNIVVWANDHTAFAGTISARGSGSGIGGNAEVSGKNTLDFGGAVDLGSESGIGGNLLLDPGDFTVDGSNVATIVDALETGANVNITTNAAAAGNGDVFVNTPVVANRFGSNLGVLSILAHRHIVLNERIQLGGDGGAVNLIAGWDGSTGFSPIPGSGIATPTGVPNMPDFPETEQSFGNNMGSVRVGNATFFNEPVWVGSQNGPTAVLGYDLVVNADPAYHAGIGFVGSGDATGEISVDVRNSVILNSANSVEGRTRIGHEISSASTISGDIRVEARQGDIQVNSAADPAAVAAIGHYAPLGSVTGDLSAHARNGAVSIVSGGADAFIGNYTQTAIGSDLTVEGAEITLDATNGLAAIGHTDGDVISAAIADGGLSIRAQKQLSLIDGVSAGQQWRIGHENLTGIDLSPLAIGIGGLSRDGLENREFLIDQDFADRVISPAIPHGSVTLASIGSLPVTMGDAIGIGGLRQDAVIDYTSDNDLNLLSEGELGVSGSITNQSSTGGRINIVSGWQSNAGFPAAAGGPGGPGEFDPTALAADPTGFGRHNDFLGINGNLTNQGDINLFGGFISVDALVDPSGGNTNIHLGARPGGVVAFGEHVYQAQVFGNSTNDSIVGPNEEVNWLIDADNAGDFAGVSVATSPPPGEEGAATAPYSPFPLVKFQGIENLTGGTQNDAFTFIDGASLSGTVDGGGGSGSDFLLIDDSASTNDHFYRISRNRVSVNPTYDFVGIETLAIQAGTGTDNFSTQFFDFQQNLDGGGGPGVNRLGVLLAEGIVLPGNTSPLLPPAGRDDLGQIFFINMDSLIISQASSGKVVKTRIVDAPARGIDGIRVRNLKDIPDSEGLLLAQIDPIIQQQTNDAQNQLAAEVQTQENEPAANPIANQAPQNNTPPGEGQDVNGDSGPVEMDGAGSRTSVNMPPAVQQRFDNMFNPQDWGGTGLNIN